MNNLTMTFTVEEWRLIAVACMMVKPQSLAQRERKVDLQNIALRIATETGKHHHEE